MNKGKIIFLNGTSSAGKTSIARELQSILDEPYIFVAFDTFVDMLPEKFLATNAQADKGFHWIPVEKENKKGVEVKTGPIGQMLVSGMHHSIAALVNLGNNVIVEHVLLEKKWLKECIELFSKFHVLSVGIHCPLEVVEKREKERGDRVVGQTRAMFSSVHFNEIYDLNVDTSLTNPKECAQQIKAFQEKNHSPGVFSKTLKNTDKTSAATK